MPDRTTLPYHRDPSRSASTRPRDARQAEQPAPSCASDSLGASLEPSSAGRPEASEGEAPAWGESQRRAARVRLRVEGRRLARLARVRHFDYDLNRHIAVVRRLAEVDAEPGIAATGPSGGTGRVEPSRDGDRRRSWPASVHEHP